MRMSDKMASLNMQAQIRHNAETVQDYFRDLQKWRSAIKENEAAVEGRQGNTKSSAKSPQLAAPPSDCSTALPGSSQNNREDREPRSRGATVTRDNTVNSACKYKPVLARDGNSIASYYAAWDRFNVDEELAKLDSDDSRGHTSIRQNVFKTAPPIESKGDSKNSSSAARRRGTGTMRTVVKTREPNDAEAADTDEADSSTAPTLRPHKLAEDVDRVLQSLRTQLLNATALNQASLLDYSFSRCRSAIKGFERCLSCLEEQSLSRALSISASMHPRPSLLSHWKKIRSIFQTNLGFSQLCLSRSNQAVECAASAQRDWPESPFVHLLQAACHKVEGNYAQAGRHLRDLLACLSREGRPTPTHVDAERNPKGVPGPTTADLLDASIAALDTCNFSILSSIIAITCTKTDTAAAAFVRANTHNGIYRGQLLEHASDSAVSQELPISKTQRIAGTACLKGNQGFTETTCPRSAATPPPREESPDRTATEVADFGGTGTRKEEEGAHRPVPCVIPLPCFDLKDAVSAELSETLALRHREVLAMRRRRQQDVWQLSQKRLQEIENEIQVRERIPGTPPVSEMQGGSSGRSEGSKMGKKIFQRATTSGSRDSHAAAVEASQQNCTKGLTLGIKPGRQLHVHDLRDSLYSEERQAQCQVPLKMLLASQKQAEVCAPNIDEPASGLNCRPEANMQVEKNEKLHGKKWCATSSEANDEQLCLENTSLSLYAKGEGETDGHSHSVSFQPRDSPKTGLNCVATFKERVIPPVRQIGAASEASQAACTESKYPRAPATSMPRLLPPSTYFSFQKEWNAACHHDLEWECRAKLGTAASCTTHGGNVIAQPQGNTAGEKKSSHQCMPCLLNKLSLLGSVAEHELFSRVFTVSMEPDVLADIVEVITEGLQYTVKSSNKEETAASEHLESGSRIGVQTAVGHTIPSEPPPTCEAPDGESTNGLPGARIPETKGWLSLTCVQNILVQLSEVPRFWSTVYQFDKQELRKLHHVLHYCLQEGETSEQELQDAEPSTPVGLCTLKQRTDPRVRPAQPSLACRIRDIEARLLEIGI